MSENNDYHDILGINPDASFIQIKEAYIYKAHLLHPDRLTGVSERIRLKAENELKLVNEAYAVLSNPGTKRQYDIKRFGSVNNVTKEKTKQDIKPKVGVYPKLINFKGVLPYVKQRDTFFVRNMGGPFKKMLISKTPKWITVVQTKPLQKGMKLPMQVQIEAIGIKWGTTYSSPVIIRLDESEAKVMVRLSVQNKPRKFLFW